MKTTSYKISKQLAEAGFEAYTQFYHSADAKCISRGKDEDDYELIYNDLSYSQIAKNYNIPAYDLETILDALPEMILLGGFPKQLPCTLYISKKGIGYDYERGLTSLAKENESLADCAARLLLLLVEKGLLTFKK